jgi:hypothetical protein
VNEVCTAGTVRGGVGIAVGTAAVLPHAVAMAKTVAMAAIFTRR